MIEQPALRHPARRAQIKANAERRAAALADVPEVLPRPKRPATATGVGLGVGLDGAAIARQQGANVHKQH